MIIKDGREIRRRSAGSIQCPICHKKCTLWQETEQWVEKRNGGWKHDHYGPPSGDCCGLAFIDSPWDGLMTIEIDPPTPPARERQ